MPMLDEEEFARVSLLYSEGMRATKEFRQKHGIPLAEASIDDRFRPVREEYERITGRRNIHQNAIIHHRISLYGPPCPKCGKPFRTVSANFCAECGQKTEPNQALEPTIFAVTPRAPSSTSRASEDRGSLWTFGKTMKEILAPILIGFLGCALFYFRRPVGIAAEKISFPPFFRGDQNARIRLFGMIGIVYALISFGIGGLFWLSNQWRKSRTSRQSQRDGYVLSV